MADITKKLIYLFVIVQILIQCIIVESKAAPKKGNGKALGAAVIAGLGGAAIGHALTRPKTPAEQHHYHYYPNGDPNAGVPRPVQQARPSMTIERGETLPNGCYKQTVKEPDAYDATKFIETEQLICPPNVQASPPYIHPAAGMPQQPQPVVPALVPVQPVVPIQPMAPSYPIVSQPPHIVGHAPQPPNINESSQFPPLVPGHTVPLAPLVPVPMVPVGTHIPQPPVVQPVHPQQPAVPGPPSNSATSQVIVLSKKTGSYADNKKKNDANSLLTTNYVVMLVMIAFLYLI